MTLVDLVSGGDHALRVSCICLGLAGIGLGYSEEDGKRILDQFVDAGGNFIDTARVYSDWGPGERHRSERILGDWLETKGPSEREKLVVATKGGHPEVSSMDKPRLGRRHIFEDLEGSLKTLRLERIPLYYLHRDDPRLPAAEILEVLFEARKQGKVDNLGCSNWSVKRIVEAAEAAQRSGRTGFVANQPMWNIGSANMHAPTEPGVRRMDADMMQLHRRTRMLCVPFSSQAHGFFTKQVRGEDTLTGALAPYATEENRALAERLAEMAPQLGVTVNQLVVSYLLHQDIPTAPVVGCRSPEQLADSIASTDLHLDPWVVEELQQLSNQPWAYAPNDGG